MSSGKVHAITSIKAHLGSLDLCAGKKEGPQMGLEFLWLILAVVLGGYVFVLGFLKRFNEWYYVGRLGKTQYPLPPGDMGWPYLGCLPTFLKAFKSNDPDSFIYNLVSK
jgi:ent-kaurenoic acid hydroxylase